MLTLATRVLPDRFPRVEDRAGNDAEDPICPRGMGRLLAQPGQRCDEVEQFCAVQVGARLAIGLRARQERGACGAQADA